MGARSQCPPTSPLAQKNCLRTPPLLLRFSFVRRRLAAKDGKASEVLSTIGVGALTLPWTTASVGWLQQPGGQFLRKNRNHLWELRSGTLLLTFFFVCLTCTERKRTENFEALRALDGPKGLELKTPDVFEEHLQPLSAGRGLPLTPQSCRCWAAIQAVLGCEGLQISEL